MRETERSDPSADTPPVARHARRWAVLLVVVGAVAGGLLGWASQEPIYRSRGVVFVEPRPGNAEDPCGPGQLPMFEGFMAYQVQLLQATRTTQLALETETWKATGEGADAVAALQFESRRRVVRESGSQIIVVRFEDPVPEVALAGLRALLEAYERLIAEENEADKLLEHAQAEASHLAEQIEEITQQMLDLTKEFGGAEGLEVMYRAAVEALSAAEQAGASEEELAKLREQVRRLGEALVQVAPLRHERERLVRALDQMKLLVDQLECRLAGSGHITVRDRGVLPTDALRREPPWVPAVGAAAGALLGLLLAFLIRRGGA